MNIVRLYNCPYFINGECSLRSHDDPLIDFWDSKCITKDIIPHCPKGRAYCHINVDTDKWSKGTLELIRILVKGWRREGNGNAVEIIDIIEQILRRQDDMATICMTTKQFEEEKQRARQEGRKEAWDLARRIAAFGEDTYTWQELDSVFGSHCDNTIFELPVEFAMAKDAKYQKDALHVGDEVKVTAYGVTRKGYIINVVSPALVRVLTKDLGTYPVGPQECEKTGKHNPDVKKVMASFEEKDSE